MINRLLLFVPVLLINLTGLSQEITVKTGDALPQSEYRKCQIITNDGRSIYTFTDAKSNRQWVSCDKNLVVIKQAELTLKAQPVIKKKSEKNPLIIVGCLEIKGQIYFFLQLPSADSEDEINLYRVKFNNDLTSIMEETLVLRVKGSYFNLKQDENSDHYAVVNRTEKDRTLIDRNDNYTIYHFNADHKEIARADFDYVNNKYKYGSFLDFTVYGDKYIITANYVYNSESKRKIDTKLVFSKLEKGKNTFSHYTMNSTENFVSDKCILRKNNQKQLLQALVYTQVDKGYDILTNTQTTYYVLLMQNINPESMLLKEPFLITNKKLDEYVIKNCGLKNGFTQSGLINDFIVSSTGNNFFTVSNPSFYGFFECDANGTELNAWAYPSVFFTYYIIENGGEYFILLNELEANMSKALKEKFKSYNAEKGHLIFLGLRKNGDLTRKYVFEPADQRPFSYLETNFLGEPYFNSKVKTCIVKTKMGKGKNNSRWISLIFN